MAIVDIDLCVISQVYFVVLVDCNYLVDTFIRDYREYRMNIIKGDLLKKGFFCVTLFCSSYVFANQDVNSRNARYCEVIVGKGLQASVYTTFKLNNCPQNLWNQLDTKLIKKQNHASFVYLNGPRHFMFDKYIYHKLTNTIDEKSFCGLKMRKAATVRVRFTDIIKGFRPYIEHEIHRHTVWIYEAGKPVYELISPNNKVYVMQSYSDEKVDQNEKTLAKLGSILHLPKGWKFKTGILKKNQSIVTQDNIAIVTQDELKNTYQLTTQDLLS